jgi:hypothetical protein
VAALAIGAANPISPTVVTASAKAWLFLIMTFPSPFLFLPPDGHRQRIHTWC